MRHLRRPIRSICRRRLLNGWKTGVAKNRWSKAFAVHTFPENEASPLVQMKSSTSLLAPYSGVIFVCNFCIPLFQLTVLCSGLVSKLNLLFVLDLFYELC